MPYEHDANSFIIDGKTFPVNVIAKMKIPTEYKGTNQNFKKINVLFSLPENKKTMPVSAIKNKKLRKTVLLNTCEPLHMCHNAIPTST